MNLNNEQRELIERSLDELYDAIMDAEDIDGDQLLKVCRLYVAAVAIVRERPACARKVRSDFYQKRPTSQAELAA